MLRFSKKKIYAVEAVLDIAFHGVNGPVQARDIASRQAIPARYLEHVLQQLVRAGILKGVRGPKGGYRLGRAPSEINLVEVTEVVRRLVAGTSLPDLSSDIGVQLVRPLSEKLESAMLAELRLHTVQSMLDQSKAA